MIVANIIQLYTLPSSHKICHKRLIYINQEKVTEGETKIKILTN